MTHLEPEHAYDMMGPPVTIHTAAHPAAPAPGAPPVHAMPTLLNGTVVHIQPPTGIVSPMGQLVLGSILAVLGGIALGGFVFLASVAFSVWGSKVQASFAIEVFVVASLIGIGVSILRYLPWRKPMTLSISAEGASISSPAYRAPFFIPRAEVRLVDFDARPRSGLTDVKRFPISGDVPDTVKADPLDRYPNDQWEPGDRSPVPRDPALDAAHRPAWVSPPGEDQAGWAAYHPEGRRTAPPPVRAEQSFLYSGDGSALPVLRFNIADLPNVAILFKEPLKTPPAPIAFTLAGNILGPRLVVNRVVRGLMIRVTEPQAAKDAFGAWGVVRGVTAEDVLAEKLRPPKPLRGMRAVVFVVASLVPLVLRAVLRSRRHGFYHRATPWWMYFAMLPVALAIFGVVLLGMQRKWKREAGGYSPLR